MPEPHTCTSTNQATHGWVLLLSTKMKNKTNLVNHCSTKRFHNDVIKAAEAGVELVVLCATAAAACVILVVDVVHVITGLAAIATECRAACGSRNQ